MSALIASVRCAAKTLTSLGVGKCTYICIYILICAGGQVSQAIGVAQPSNTFAVQYTQQSRKYGKQNNNIMVDPKRVVSYEDMLKVIQQPEKVIIDVRNLDEIKATGKIPSSINIPLGEVQNVLTSMSEEEFKKNFQRRKPTSSDELIFYCQSGRRSSEALDKALKLGYSNSKTYLGSWNDWSSRQQ